MGRCGHHLGHHAGDVATPRGADILGSLDAEGEVDGLDLVDRGEVDSVAPSLAADLGVAVDRHRQDEAAGVVGVVADQVHPTRGDDRELSHDRCRAAASFSSDPRSNGARRAMLTWSAPAST